MRLITHIVEPKRLLLVWQSPEMLSDANTEKPAHRGKRYLVGEVLFNTNEAELRYFENEDIAEAQKKGFEGLTAFPYRVNPSYTSNVLAVLQNRLPPKSRTDFGDFLRSYRLSPELAVNISIPALLGYTLGRLSGDGFSFYHTFEEAAAPFDFTFEIAGFRHNDGMNLADIRQMLYGQQVSLTEEDCGQHDPNAVAVYHGNIKLGYVPRGLSAVVKRLLSAYTLQAYIERVNGTKERPALLVFVQAR